jgi:TatD DNase family protein
VLIDTHCHLNIMVKKTFDTLLHDNDKDAAHIIIDDASAHKVTTIINVGTSLVESQNCVKLAQWFANNYAVVGMHPNDVTSSWQQDLRELASMCRKISITLITT